MTTEPAERAARRAGLAWLALIAAVFLAWHVPLMYATPAGLDEDWYSVPGIAILRSGMPKIPYLPSRDPKSFCYGADIALFALPPLSFYLQAGCHLVLGLGLGPARMASAIEGLGAAYLCYALALRWGGDRRGAILAAAAYVASRTFVFPATMARPDMAATTFGLLAVTLADRARTDDRARFPASSGLAAGLSLLAHPFGAVPAMQVGLCLLLIRGSARRRIGRAALFSAVCLAVFSTWGLLIARAPDLFRIQFGNNVLNRAGPGLGTTLRAPGPVLAFQAAQFLGRAGPIQAGLYAAALAWTIARARRPGSERILLGQVLASIALLILLQGHHPTLGYLAYPSCFLSVALGLAASDLMGRLDRAAPGHPRAFAATVTVALLAAFLPGAGVRALAWRVGHAGDPLADARGLARAIMADIPRDVLVAVDGPFVLEFYLDGRAVIDASTNTSTFDFRATPYAYAVLGRAWKEADAPAVEGLELLGTYGDAGDRFAPYAELYRRQRP